MLQISEPGQSKALHRKSVALGIDLGTTYSLVATERKNEITCLADADGRVLFPSAARVIDGQISSVGWQALAEENGDLIVSSKRLMGKALADFAQKKTDLPIELADNFTQLEIRTGTSRWSPVHVAAAILQALYHRAQQHCGDDICGAVITVPAYFDDAQRQATKDAAKIAGIHVLRLLNEPTAAALAYGLDNGVEGVYAIYDLGGGTFDISILRLTKGVFEVVATGGNTHLGGDDFDAAIARWLLDAQDLSSLSKRDYQQWLAKARRAKETLSSESQVALQDLHAQEKILTREEFETITHSLIERSLECVSEACTQSGLEQKQIQGVVLVGGSTRMPCVRRAVQSYFGQSPLVNLDPDQVVAIGAAKQAQLLAGRNTEQDWLLIDVVPLSLGIELAGGLCEKIIERNSMIPCVRKQEFTTYKDGQTAMVIHVLQGERELVQDCRSLARFELRGIPPLAAGIARIEVEFRVDADGLLLVQAKELSTGTKANIHVKPSYGLSEEAITSMIKESSQQAANDMKMRSLREDQIDAERLCNAIAHALTEDADLLNEMQLQKLEQSLHKLQALLTSSDRDALRHAKTSLEQVSEEFASARMNRAITRALSGKAVAHYST